MHAGFEVVQPLEKFLLDEVEFLHPRAVINVDVKNAFVDTRGVRSRGQLLARDGWPQFEQFLLLEPLLKAERSENGWQNVSDLSEFPVRHTL